MRATPFRFSSEKRKMSFSVVVLVNVANRLSNITLRKLISEKRKVLHRDCPVKFVKKHFRPRQQNSAYTSDTINP